MSVRPYNPSVRVGNWNEDIQLQEETLKDFLDKREKGQLLMQRTQIVISAAKVSISRDGVVHYGDQCMLVNKPPPGGRDECALSKNFTADILLAEDPMSIPPSLSGSRSVEPSTRNLLIVTSPIGKQDGEPLLYNEPFYLCMPTDRGLFYNMKLKTLYLSSEVATFENSSKKARHCSLSLVHQPSFSAQFEVNFFDPRLRIEFEHHPVPANKPVVITHQKTNRNLAVEAAHKLRTMFGGEFEISCHTYVDAHKAEVDTNHWMFVMEVPGDTYCAPAPEFKP